MSVSISEGRFSFFLNRQPLLLLVKIGEAVWNCIVFLFWKIIIKGIFWNQIKSIANLALLLLPIGGVSLVAIPVNNWRTAYSVNEAADGTISHGQDELTTQTINQTVAEAYPDPSVREEALRKIRDMQRATGHTPQVRLAKEEQDFPGWIKTTFTSGNESGSYYNSFTNTILIGEKAPVKSLVAENAHVIQFREQPYRSYARMFEELARSFGCTTMGLPSEFMRHYFTGYKRPGTIEHEAHQVIEPRLIEENRLEELLLKAESRPVVGDLALSKSEPQTNTLGCAPTRQ